MKEFDKLLMATLVSGIICGCDDKNNSDGDEGRQKTPDNPTPGTPDDKIKTEHENFEATEQEVKKELSSNADFNKKNEEQKKEVVKRCTNAVLSMQDTKDLYDPTKKQQVQNKSKEIVKTTVEQVANNQIEWKKASDVIKSDAFRTVFSENMVKAINENFTKQIVDKSKNNKPYDMIKDTFNNKLLQKFVDGLVKLCDDGKVLVNNTEEIGAKKFAEGCGQKLGDYIKKLQSNIDPIVAGVNESTQFEKFQGIIDTFVDNIKIDQYIRYAKYVTIDVNKKSNVPLFILDWSPSK